MIMRLLRRNKGYSCHQVLEVMQSYIDGEVDEKTALNVVEHLEMCERCAHEVHLFRRIQNAVREQADEIDPRIVERLEAYALELSSADPNSHDSQNN